MPILGTVASQFSGKSFNSFESIATAKVGSGGQSNITFTLIPQTFTHLQIRAFTRDVRSETVNTFNMRVGNGSIDSGANYSIHTLSGDGSSPSAAGAANFTHHTFMLEAGASATAGIFGVNTIDILDYTNTSKYKTSRALGGVDFNGSGNVTFTSASWRNTAAIDTIQFFNNGDFNFAQYTQIALYGIKGV